MIEPQLTSDIGNQYRAKASISDKLLYSQIHLTHRCQYSCAHCYHKEMPDGMLDLPLKDMEYIVQQISNTATQKGVLARIDFIGGDPILYPWLEEAISLCNNNRIAYGLKCNPDYFINNSRASIKSTLENCTGISISIDGLPTFHDLLRGKGSFAKVMDAIQVINSIGYFLRLNMTLSRQNVSDLIPLTDFLCRQNIVVDAFTWSRYWSKNNVGDMISLSDLPEIFDKYLECINNHYKTDSFFLNEKDLRRPRINTIFKEHLWFPYFVHRGCIKKELANALMHKTNCLNCSATKESLIIDSPTEIFRCRKMVDSKLKSCFSAPYDSVKIDMGVCMDCSFINVCAGCPAIFKAFAGAQGECPYFEKALFSNTNRFEAENEALRK